MDGRPQQAFADAIGVSLSGLRKWLAGETIPTIEHGPALKAVTGRTLDWLITGDDAVRPESSVESYKMIAYNVAQFMAKRLGKDPTEFAELFKALCEYLEKDRPSNDLGELSKMMDLAGALSEKKTVS